MTTHVMLYLSIDKKFMPHYVFTLHILTIDLYSSILGQPQNEYFTNIAKDCNMSGNNDTIQW